MKLTTALLGLMLFLMSAVSWAAPTLLDPDEYEAQTKAKAQEGKPPPGSDATERYRTETDTQRQKSTTDTERAKSTTDSTRQTGTVEERKHGQSEERQKGKTSESQRRDSEVDVQ